MSSSASNKTARSASFAQRCAREAARYLDRRGYPGPAELPAPDPALELVVVIPAMAEPVVVKTLESLAAATAPARVAEVLLVINAPVNARPDQKQLNEQCLLDARAWVAAAGDSRLRCHVLDCRDLSMDHAGVGRARKIGMDAALARLAVTNSCRGVIISLDADCHVATNYLTAIDHYFSQATDALAATVYFEHPLDQAPADTRSAIIDYELHLRCYRHGLQAAGSSYASYTVGSAFAVRSEIYAQEGGMNQRAAGEDFYFINKLLKRGPVDEIDSTTVYPSARVSDRVPFGTGAAMRRAQDEAVTTYAPAVYRELQGFQEALRAQIESNQPLPPRYAPFLKTMAFARWLEKTRANVASTGSLMAQVNRWLDGFRTMKFIHWQTESAAPRVAVADAAREILGWSGISPANGPEAMLEQFRRLDRQT